MNKLIIIWLWLRANIWNVPFLELSFLEKCLCIITFPLIFIDVLVTKSWIQYR